MAGIYIHIPFCRRACHYCDFHFTTNLKNSDGIVDSILKEIEIQKEYLNQESISTIYFGGGTPTLLPTVDLERIIDQISTYHSIKGDAEITVEANPEDLSIEKLSELRAIGVNRLSLGTQSFIDAELKWMNRMHRSTQAIEAIKNAQELGFDNISIDLIFGLPNQTKKDWEFNLDAALNLNVQHISSYGLTIEDKTVLSNRIKKGLEKHPDDKRSTEFFKMNMDVFPSNGFEHYEISNFAQEGFISKHNSSYWRGIPYLGLGPSAHSFNGKTRQWNVRSNAAYVSNISNTKPYFEIEELTQTDQLNEQIMIGLRTKWGIRKNEVDKLALGSWDKLQQALQEKEPSLFLIDKQAIRLSNSGRLVADRLASELFFD